MTGLAMPAGGWLDRAAAASRSLWPGLAAAVVLAVAAGWMAGGLGEPLSRNPVLVAMLLGLVLGVMLPCPPALRPGLDFTKRRLLRLAVVLVGFRITGELLLSLGPLPWLVALAELLLVLLGLRWLAQRVFGLDPMLAWLLAAGSAICGAAAVLAVAAVLRARDEHASLAVALITLAGTVALLLWPVAFLAGALPGLDETGYGVFVGATVYELAQVYGAAVAVSEGALHTATLVKLGKVLMLLPVLLVLSLVQRRRDRGAARAATPWPWFILAFAAVVAFNSVVTLHPLARLWILQVDQFLFLMVMVALGLTTPIAALRAPGLSMRLLGVACAGLLLSGGSGWLLLQLAAPPAPAVQGEMARVLRSDGGRLFVSTGCAHCHVPALPGRQGEVVVYSDLLLHDMGPALDDRIVQGDALGAEWRTTPLLGLSQRRRYLHDGRATTLRDAVLAHGGTAERVRDRFFELDAAEQQRLLRFIQGL